MASRPGKEDSALADVHDVEAFLATLPKERKQRLAVLRLLFQFARAQKTIFAG